VQVCVSWEAPMSQPHEFTFGIFDHQITQLQDRVEVLRGLGGGNEDGAVDDLQAALEELNVAQEELRAQHEQLLSMHEQIENERQRFRELFEFAPDGYLVTDSSGVILQANRAAGRLLRTRADLLVGKPVVNFVAMDQRRLWRERLLGLGAASEVQEFEAELAAREGEPVTVSVRVATAPVSTGARPALEIRWLLRDIRHQKKLQQRMVQLNVDLEERVARRTEELRQANQAKDQFLAVLSHELRTPLTPVLALVSAMEEDGELPSQVRSDLGIVRRNVELETALIDDLLDLTRIARGKLQLNQEQVDLHELLGNVIGICREDIDSKGLEFYVDFNADRHHVSGDPSRLQQVLWNLLKNAIKYTPAGGTVRVRSSVGAQGHVRVEVIDSGIGIEPELLPVVFDAFRQGEQVITRRMGGLGLGLTITRSLVELHGGTLNAFSEGRDRGSTFTLELPTVDPPQPSARSACHDAEGEAALRILLVDDHQDTTAILSRLLTRLGHSVRAAHSVTEAQEAALGEKFDLLLTDMGLPDGTGIDLIKKLRRLQYPLQAIALSGFGAESDIKASRAAGAIDHLVKPIDLLKLKAVLSRVQPAVRNGS
jgi:PAS domain S-box-containing protein